MPAASCPSYSYGYVLANVASFNICVHSPLPMPSRISVLDDRALRVCAGRTLRIVSLLFRNHGHQDQQHAQVSTARKAMCDDSRVCVLAAWFQCDQSCVLRLSAHKLRGKTEWWSVDT